MWSKEGELLQQEGSKRRGRLRLLAKAIKEAHIIRYKPTITNRPLRGANQIRIRILCGTDALNDSQSRIQKGARTAYCPWSMCQDNKLTETPEHFLVECDGYTDDNLKEKLNEHCKCPQGMQRCGTFFDSLTPARKSAFILGVPVPEGEQGIPRVAEESTDAVLKEFVLERFEARKSLLEGSEDESSRVVDFTDQKTILSVFARQRQTQVTRRGWDSAPSHEKTNETDNDTPVNVTARPRVSQGYGSHGRMAALPLGRKECK